MPLTNTFIEEKPKRVKKKRVQKVKIKSNNVLYSKIGALGFGTLLLNKLDNKKDDYEITISNIHKSHKIEMHIDSEEQLTYLKQSVGCSRKAYNLALAYWKEQYDKFKAELIDELPNKDNINKYFNSIKREQYPYFLDVSKYVMQKAIIDLGTAFKNFFNKKSGYPTFKKKYSNDSFYLCNDVIKVDYSNNKITLPKIKLPFRLKEFIRFTPEDGAKLESSTVSRQGHKWFISLSYSFNVKPPEKTYSDNQTCVGVDLGLKKFLTSFDGNAFDEHAKMKPYRQKLKRIQSLSKSLSRKTKVLDEDGNKVYSNNRNKAKIKLSKLHYEISCCRLDAIHKTTSYLANNFDIVCIENLDVKSMVKNNYLSLSIADSGFGMFKEQLRYKCSWYGKHLVEADKFYPSSKICSCCGHKYKELSLGESEWQCEHCHSTHDRDENASINLQKLGQLAVALSNKENELKELDDYWKTLLSHSFNVFEKTTVNGILLKDF